MKTQYLAIILLVLPFITENPSHEDAPCSTDSVGKAIFSRGGPASNPEILDSHGKAIYGPITVGQQIQVSSVVNNGQNCVQPFAYLVQIQDLNGVTVSLSWINGTLSARQSLTPAQSWTPTGPGTYTAQIFTWQSIDNPNAMAPPLSAAISVEPNSNLTQPSQVVSRVPSKFTSANPTTVQVVMSSGAGANQNCVPATNCFDPRGVTIQPRDTVTWINNDIVGHTTTSGSPSDNDTGDLWDSGIVRPGGNYSFTFYSGFVGNYHYFCKVHPWMRGQVIGTELLESPMKQVKSGTSSKGIKCDQGQVLVIKSDNSPACVKPTTAQKLVELGWGVLKEQMVWFEYTPIQCQKNPWDQTPYNMTSITVPLPLYSLMQVYFKDEGIPIFEVRQTSNGLSTRPLICGEPTDNSFFFRVSESDVDKMTKLGFKILTIPLPADAVSVS